MCVWRAGGNTGMNSRPRTSFRCSMWSAAEPRLTYSELALRRLASFHFVSLWNTSADKKKKKKSTNQNWIIGQAREEGRDWFLSDRLPRFFQGCERTWSETNLPKIMHCGCSVLALCEAVTLCCIYIPKELLKQGPSLGGSWLSLLLICHNMSHA